MCVFVLCDIWVNIKYNILKFYKIILGLFPSSCNIYVPQDTHKDALSGIHISLI